jgi:hypothetical protein
MPCSEIGYVFEGMVVRVLPSLGDDDRFTVDLRAGILGPVTAMREQRLPKGSAGDVLYPEKDAEDSREKPKPDEIPPPPAKPVPPLPPGTEAKEAVIELPEQDIQSFDTSVQARDGRYVALESTRPSSDTAGAKSVTVLLVKVAQILSH